MPCYTASLMSVELATGNRKLLEKAVAKLGMRIDGNRIYTPNGTILLDGNTATCPTSCLPHVNAIRVEYSRQAVTLAASKSGWSKVQTGSNKFVVKKGV